MDNIHTETKKRKKEIVAPDLFGMSDPGAYPNFPGHKGELATGREAAQKISKAVTGIRRQVLSEYRGALPGGLSPDEAAGRLDLSILTVRPRCSELLALGYLEALADRRKNASGLKANVLRATQDGIAALAVPNPRGRANG